MAASESLEKIARRTLELEGDQSVPQFYLPLLKRFLDLHPEDTNFIVELPEPDQAFKGGNGHGSVTCMELDCWVDVPLGSDPDRPNGGKDDGFGSFYNYERHCTDTAAHITARDRRIDVEKKLAAVDLRRANDPAKNGASSATTKSSAPFTDLQHNNPAGAGPSRAIKAETSLSSSPATPIGGTSTRVLQPSSSTNSLGDIKPAVAASRKGSHIDLTKGRGSNAEPILIDSESDSEDGVVVLDDAEVPTGLRKVTNKENPVVLSDDDDIFMSSPVRPTSSPSSRLFNRDGSRKSLHELLHNSQSSRPASPFQTRSISTPRSGRDAKPSRQSLLAPDEPPTMSTSIPTPQGLVPAAATLPSWRMMEYKAALTGQRQSATTLSAMVNSLSPLNRLNLARDELLLTAKASDIPLLQTRIKSQLNLRMSGLRFLILNDGRTLYHTPPLEVLQQLDTLDQVWDKHLGPLSSASPVPVTPSTSYIPSLDMGIRANTTAGPSNSLTRVTASPSSITTKFDQLARRLSQMIKHEGPSSLVRSLGAGGLTFPPSIQAGAGYTVSGHPMPGQYDDSDFGYEMDRPATADGLTNLFQTALDDFQEDVDVDTALAGLGLNRLDSKLDGLSIQLMPHQVIGVHWMIEQEKKGNQKGGILGDEMGLGKTIQAIATMTKNPSEDRKIRATLIVVPLPLLSQWKAEIEEKSELSVLIYHGPNRTKSMNALRNVDVVLTTYSIIVGEGSELLPKKKKKKRRDDFVSDDEADERPVTIKQKGPLFKIAWYRIILDEAANIRNKSTKASRLVHELHREISWCLTGTLIYNTLTDIFPYLHFVGVVDWDDFRNRIHLIAARKPQLAAKRSQALLRKVMLRRTKQSELHGKKILQLPPKTIDMVELDFTDEERAIYKAVETTARVKVNSWYKAGTVLKHYHVILVMLTRLRQLCCHPWLLRATHDTMPHMHAVTVDDEDDNNVPVTVQPSADDLEEIERAVQAMGQTWVDKLKEKLMERYKTSIQVKTEDEEVDKNDDFSCSICFEPFDQERITACQHSFCAACTEDLFNAPLRDATNMTEEQVARHARLCPLCRSEIYRDKLFRGDAFFNPENYRDPADLAIDVDIKPGNMLAPWLKGKKRLADDDDVKPDVKRIKATPDVKGKGKAKAEPDAEDEDGTGNETVDELADDNESGEIDIEDVLPSTKMKRIGDILDNWHEVDPTQKTLIFSSFVEMLELMAIFLRKRGIKYVMYTGKLKPAEREDAIKRFTKGNEKDAPRVMLISLKCGGVGLNLTAANTVIGLDLAWSPAAEAQAIDRAHRIGQTKPVSVKRLIVRGTVEERILALQEKKQALADGAMGEGDGGRLGRLSARELVRLFGSEDDE